jgi:Flp pilus assembly protein TadG
MPRLISRRRFVHAALGRGRREGGQALVEMALAMPLLIIMLFGILQFGIIYNQYITLTDAVRSGARELSLERGETNPCNVAANSTVAAGSEINLASAKVTVSFASGDTSSCTGSPGSYTSGTLVEGDSGTVTATAPFQISIMGLPLYSGNLSAAATDAVE